MIREIIASGKTVEEALELGKQSLGVGPLDENVQFEIIHTGSRGIFGIIGVKPAKVRVYIETPDQEPEKKPHHDRPKNKKNKQKQKPKADKKPKEDKPEDKPERPASIPEVEIKLERRDVKDGEDMSFEFVKTLIADIGLNAEATLYSCDDGTRRIIITGEDASILIGHHGDTLDALQYLANLASARKNINGERDKTRVTIDIEGYRAKREETLRALARRMASKALRNRRSVMLEPMTPYERRIIHSEIQAIEGVSTKSVGSDNNRKIVIFLTDKKPKELFAEDNASDEAEAPEVAEEIEATEANDVE